MLFFSKLPLILQTEMSECGLAALAMVLIYHGAIQHFTEVRFAAESSHKGMDLYQLKKIAQKFGLQADVLRIEIEQLATVKLPCIMHWSLNHFVVVRQCKKHHVIIHDPARGMRLVSREELDRHFTGIVIEISRRRNKPVKKMLPNRLGLRFASLLQDYRHPIVQIVTVSLVVQVLMVAGIQCFRYCIDTASKQHEYPLAVYLALAFAGVKIMEVCVQGARSLMVSQFGARVNEKLSTHIMRHLLTLPLTFFNKRYLGDMSSRMSSIEKIRSILAEGLVEGVMDGVISLITLIMMFKISIRISLCVITAACVYSTIRLFYHHYFRAYNEEWLYWRAHENSHLLETLQAMPAIKIFSKSDSRLSAWRGHAVRQMNAASKLFRHKTLLDSGKNMLQGMDLAITLTLSSLLLSQQQLSLGLLTAFLAYRSQFVSAISGLVDKWGDYHLLSLHLDKLNDIVSTPSECHSVVKQLRFPEVSQSSLELRGIVYAFGVNEEPLFKNINFTVNPGEILAITGVSGSGKTTLLKIMLGLLPPTRGELYLNQTSVYPSHVLSYRKRIAAVCQDDILFSGTIFENISFFDENPDKDRVYEAAEQAAIFDEILAFPLGFMTRVGSMGSLLSGGQKQRVLLARAFYSRPTLLFLDEATSHLDPQKEREVNLSIRNLNITTVLIAHRQETIAMSDRIYFLSEAKCKTS